MPDDLQLSDDEKQAILAHRRDNTPKRKATLRGTDKDTGNEWEIELTAEEAAKLAGRSLAGLFASDDDGKKDDGKDVKKQPTPLRDYFKGQQAKSG